MGRFAHTACRWIYHDALLQEVPVAHSAILCFMVGPLGLLSHYITRTLILHWRKTNTKLNN